MSCLSGRVHTTQPNHHHQHNRTFSPRARAFVLHQLCDRQKKCKKSTKELMTATPTDAVKELLVQDSQNQTSVRMFFCVVPLATCCYIQLLLCSTQLCAVLHQTVPLRGQIWVQMCQHIQKPWAPIRMGSKYYNQIWREIRVWSL